MNVRKAIYFREGLVLALCAIICVGVLLFLNTYAYPAVRQARAATTASSQVWFTGTVVVDRAGNPLTDVITHQHAVAIVKDHKNSFGLSLQPIGWVDVVVIKSSDYRQDRQ